MPKTRRERAIIKIKKLERELEYIATAKGVESRIREINRLQSTYGIGVEDIHPDRKGFYVKINK